MMVRRYIRYLLCCVREHVQCEMISLRATINHAQFIKGWKEETLLNAIRPPVLCDSNFRAPFATQTPFPPLLAATYGKKRKKKRRELTLTMRDGWRKKYALEHEVKSDEKANRLPARNLPLPPHFIRAVLA